MRAPEPGPASTFHVPICKCVLVGNHPNALCLQGVAAYDGVSTMFETSHVSASVLSFGNHRLASHGSAELSRARSAHGVLAPTQPMPGVIISGVTPSMDLYFEETVARRQLPA